MTSRADAGPFVVTAPNTAVSWPVGSTQTVTWNVANTAAAPVSAANVRILLSTNGGTTFPTVLVASTPNDGSQPVVVPAGTTTTRAHQGRGGRQHLLRRLERELPVTPGGGGNLPPTANAGADQNVNAGATVTLAGSGSDPDSGPARPDVRLDAGLGPVGHRQQREPGDRQRNARDRGDVRLPARRLRRRRQRDRHGERRGEPGRRRRDRHLRRDAAGAALLDGFDLLRLGPSLLQGRGTVGPEPNQPNTINDSCADGTSGTFHSDESNDRVKVSTVDGTSFARRQDRAHRRDRLGLDDARPGRARPLLHGEREQPVVDASSTTIVPPAAGAQTLSATYTLPSGALQAVRARFRYQGSASACTTGGYIDHDDLVFAVTSTPVRHRLRGHVRDGARAGPRTRPPPTPRRAGPGSAGDPEATDRQRRQAAGHDRQRRRTTS